MSKLRAKLSRSSFARSFEGGFIEHDAIEDLEEIIIKPDPIEDWWTKLEA